MRDLGFAGTIVDRMGGVVGSGGRHLRRRIASAHVVLAILCLQIGCSLLVRSDSHQLNEEIAQIRAAGEPLTFDALRARQASGDGMDAASDYRAAMALLADVHSTPIFDLIRTYRAGTKSCPPVSPGTDVRERALHVLAESQPALDLIDRAARKEACYYAFNLETDELPSFAVFRTAGALLSLRTLESSFAGAGDDAAASVISKLRMLRVFETEPVLIGYLVRLAEWMQAGADVSAVLSAGGISEESLGDLDDALRRTEVPDLLKRTIEGERVWEIKQLAAILGPDWPDQELRSDTPTRQPFSERARLLREATDYFAVTAAVSHAAEEPWPEILGHMRTACQIPTRSASTRPPDISTVLAASLPMERAGQALATIRAGRVAIALERYRVRHRKLPASITDLPSALPTDPFTGHELLYQQTENAFLVASVGPGQATDSRAVPVDEKGRRQGISVCVPRPGR